MSFGGLERVKSGLEKENLIKGIYFFKEYSTMVLFNKIPKSIKIMIIFILRLIGKSRLANMIESFG